jgi:NAD-dependent epimerase/dehydratase
MNMSKPNVFLTGATGGMGMESLKVMVNDLSLYNLRILVRDSEKKRKILAPYENIEGLEICRGDFNDKAGLKTYLKDVSLILHVVAFVSPQADYYPKKAMQLNYRGTRNMIETLYELGQENTTKFVYIGTVAETGDRMPPIHWGRVGP